MTPLHRWARIKASIREAQNSILSAEGLDWGTFSELEQEAIASLGNAEYLDTEFGRVQRVPDGPVMWVARRSAEVKMKPTERLKLLNIPKQA